MSEPIVAAIIVAFIAGLFSLAAARLQARRGPPSGSGDETVEQRITRLTTALSESAHVIQQIEAEIEERRKTVDTLRQDAETYEKLKEVSREDVEAVSQILETQLRSEGRRSILMNTLINFVLSAVFFTLGIVGTLWYGS